MRVYRDMEITSAVQTIDRSSSEDSASSPVLSPSETPSRRSYLHRPEFTAMRQLDSATPPPVSTRVSRASESMPSSIRSSSPKPNSGGSLFQRFSKTFSLRFGNTSSSSGGSKEEYMNASSHKKMKGRKLASGSSPEIFSKSDYDVNRYGALFPFQHPS
jgi:hypothetical protein